MNGFLNVIQQILSVPAFLVGAIALVGLSLQKKPIEEIIKGTIKTIVGFLIIGQGANILVGSLNAFSALFEAAFGFQGVVPNNEAIVSLALNDFANATALIMLFGMAANLILARFSNLKYIFLTGHHTLFMACLIAVVLTVGGLSGFQLILTGSLALGFTMAFFPALAQKTMTKIVNDDTIALGHFGTIGYVFSAWIGGLVGKGSRSTEDITLSKRFSIFRDTTVSISLTMFVFFMIVSIVVGVKDGFASDIFAGQFWILYAIERSLLFSVGVYVVLAGVRLLIAEIVPAFKGISEKLVPNSKPALDCPVVFPFAPNAVVIGFVLSFTGGVVGLGILAMIGGFGYAVPLILPGVIPHFFTGATAGVFANARGGLRGCLIGSFLHGLLITFLPALLMPVLGALNFANTTFSDADFTVVGIIIGNIARFIKGYGLMAIIVAVFLLPIGLKMFDKKKSVN